jgi:hypothetical protein
MAMNGSVGAAGEPETFAAPRRGTELSNCLIRAQQAALAGLQGAGVGIRLLYVEGGTVYFYLTHAGRIDEALLERLRCGLRRELGYSPRLEQLFAI